MTLLADFEPAHRVHVALCRCIQMKWYGYFSHSRCTTLYP
jgi:hypothetical protein